MNTARPTRPALLVVDVQRDFCPGGALPAQGCEGVLPRINQYLREAVDLGLPVYASRDWHPAVTTHFQQYGGPWPTHCVEGTEGAAFHPRLKLPAGTIVVSKGDDPDRPGYSAFDGRTAEGRLLLDDLRSRGIDALYVAGLTTEYCVKQTVLDALQSGFGATVLRDAIAGIDAHPGDARRALADMEASGAQLADSMLATSR